MPFRIWPIVLPLLTLLAAPTSAEQARPKDRAVIAACLAAVTENAARQKPRDLSDQAPGVAGLLAEAALESQIDPKSCIGAVLVPCFQEPDGLSTAGMIDCANRELEVWDERLNETYRNVLAAASPRMAKGVREAQRAWIAWRDLRCKLPALEQEGGSIVGPLTVDCLRTVTAEQAIWLMALE